MLLGDSGGLVRLMKRRGLMGGLGGSTGLVGGLARGGPRSRVGFCGTGGGVDDILVTRLLSAAASASWWWSMGDIDLTWVPRLILKLGATTTTTLGFFLEENMTSI